jgi:hypothetical protein
MRRSLTAILFVLGTQASVSAKLLCPPGRFVLHPQEPGRLAALDGVELTLGEGDAAVGSACGAVPSRDFHYESGQWLLHVRARWNRCIGRRALSLRSRFDFEAIACTRLSGRLRVGRGPSVRFVADRMPVCGNGIREQGEQCDGDDESGCCGSDCRVNPGCHAACDPRFFTCDAGERCTYTCVGGGYCWPREAIDCGAGPVCGCDLRTTYANRCVAWEAASGVAHEGPCRPPPSLP